MPKIILASSSKYRQMLLQRLQIPFTAISPEIDEQRLDQESPEQLANRLALEKAQAIFTQYPDHIVIGSDQVAACEDRILGKPKTFDKAFEQLQFQSGKAVVFHTAVAVLAPQKVWQANVPTTCHYRALSTVEIDRYLHAEQPFDTAGSAKAEGLGISLMQSMCSDDPTAIIGLPLITVAQFLRQCGVVI